MTQFKLHSQRRHPPFCPRQLTISLHCAFKSTLIRVPLKSGLQNVHVDNRVRTDELAVTAVTQVPQVQLLFLLVVALRQDVDGLNGRHIRYPAVPKVKDPFLRVVQHVKLILESSNGAEEQRAVQLSTMHPTPALSPALNLVTFLPTAVTIPAVS